MQPKRVVVPVAVFVSGGGSNLQTLLDALRGSPLARVARVIASRPDAGALQRARRAGVPASVLGDPNDANEVLTVLTGIGLAVLAGYLKLIPAAAVVRFRWRMINIHPALLPDFGGPGMYGRRVHEAVLASGATESGATVHYVSEEYDRGPIIAQRRVGVKPGDTPESLAARVLEAEHQLLPRVVLELARLGLPDHAIRISS